MLEASPKQRFRLSEPFQEHEYFVTAVCLDGSEIDATSVPILPTAHSFAVMLRSQILPPLPLIERDNIS
jgi:hypothetical protein